MWRETLTFVELLSKGGFTAAYKLSVLEEADRCSNPGAIGALLRREGLYSSHLTMCRRERDAARWLRSELAAAAKPSSARSSGALRSWSAVAHSLERELSHAHTIVEVQKKLCTLLGLPTAASAESTGSEF
jgi:transposase